MIDRRDFLRIGGLSCLPLLSSPLFGRTLEFLADDAPAASGAAGRLLVLVELSGGNDGLNTVVPHRDDRYREMRPRLALPSDGLVPISDDLALHGSLAPLGAAWEAGDLATVLGLGYAQPNRSHFRSIEIWETGSDANEFLGDGWLARTLADMDRPADRAADSIILGRDNPGPLDGADMANIVLQNPANFARQAERLRPVPGHAGHAALDRVLEVNAEIRRAAAAIEEMRKNAPELGVEFAGNALGRQFRTAAQLLAAEVPVSVLKLFHGGFDTHANQLPTHARLLRELAQGLASFRSAMVKAGLWDRVLVMTYSEFGRRAAENGSGGTDHGTAAPHFVMGGRVQGGVHGAQPDLGALRGKDLSFTTDYRRVYATVREQWWELGGESPFGDHQPLALLKS